ncbi:MAG: hypothetical protein Q7R93_02730, partial [bacterium]|nr:hypothetical protein [bacterium]
MPTLPTPEQDPLLNVPASEIEEAFSNDAEEVTADEKSSERIFERNLAAATAHARRLVDSLQAEKIGESLKSTPAAPLPSGPKLKELIEEDSRRERTFLDGAAEGFKKFRLERRGVKDPAAFLVFQKYLEAHMEESEFEHTTVPTVEVEQKKEELKAKGCRVTSTYPAYGKADMSELSFMYKKPFRITKENTKPVADLLGGPLDPLEIVALLQELGFSVDGHTYNYNADVLRDFIAKPSMKETLEKLLKLGLKTNEISFSRKDAKSGYPSLGTVEEIEKISENTELLALLTDEVLGNARSLIEATKVEVPLRADRIKELVTVAGDGDARKALLALVGIRYTNLAHSPQALLFVIRAKERQLLSTVVRVSDIVDFSSISSSDPIFAFLSHTASALDVEKSLDALSVECAEGEFKPATADEPFRAFVQSMSALSGGLNAQDLVALRKLESIQSEALALAGLFKEAGVSLKYGFDKSAEAIEEIVADKALLARLLEPELRDFIRGFEKATGQSFSFFDFTKTRGTVPILELYDNTETRTALSSPATVSVIKALGSFNTNRVDMYQRLGAAPGMLLLIEELKAKFGYEPSPRGWHDAIPEQFLLDLANDVSAHKHFCSEPVVAFFNRLRTDFGISFASQTSNRMNLNLLAGRAGSAELEEQIYDAQNLDFIKQFAPRDIETIYLLANVPQELRPVASRLRAEFRYDLQFSHAGVLEDEAGLQLLVSDTVKEQKLFAPEQASRIKRVLRCGYFSHSTVSDLSAMGDLPPPAVDLIEALHTHLRYHFRLSDAY